MNAAKKLRELGVQPVEGQNFLESEAVIEALVEAGEPEGHVIEVGGGTGKITEKLMDRCNQLTVVEKDSKLAKFLESEFPEVEIINQDLLDMDLDSYDRCISNIPFHLSSEILERLGEAQLQSSLIVQEELADKIVAESGSKNYSEFTVMINYYFIPVKLQTVSRDSFYPEPEVDAAILKLYPNRERHGVEDEQEFFTLVKALFTNQRKKVRNAFVDGREILDLDKQEAKEMRDDLPHSEKRVNQLEVIQLKEISESF